MYINFFHSNRRTLLSLMYINMYNIILFVAVYNPIGHVIIVFNVVLLANLYILAHNKDLTGSFIPSEHLETGLM